MELGPLLIVIGILLALLVNCALGIVCIVIGLALILWPRITVGARVQKRARQEAAGR